MRSKASYIEQARAMVRQEAFVLALNALLLLLLVASGGMASPTAQGSPAVLGIGLASALVVPPARIFLDAARNRDLDYGLYLGLVGTALLWVPLYLGKMFGEQPEVVVNLIYVGVALLIGSVFWPTRSTSN